MNERHPGFIERATHKLTHLSSEEKAEASDGLLLVAFISALFAANGIHEGNLGGYVALGSAAIEAIVGGAMKLR